ncbi:hypothetical protein BSL78_17214 [Apostichopus japonicus]|uniref:Uncharacterized protein n=1 Tax=Stichopus japonicus TaxID=307972 RepID=A0A2G8KD96_STIJA|nr:hypothetical protein BSL78_17214 [Apostichopus japonicus]
MKKKRKRLLRLWNNLRAATGKIVTPGRGRVGVRGGGGELNAWVKGIYTKIHIKLRWTPPPQIPFKPIHNPFQYGHKIIELVWFKNRRAKFRKQQRNRSISERDETKEETDMNEKSVEENKTVKTLEEDEEERTQDEDASSAVSEDDEKRPVSPSRPPQGDTGSDRDCSSPPSLRQLDQREMPRQLGDVKMALTIKEEVDVDVVGNQDDVESTKSDLEGQTKLSSEEGKTSPELRPSSSPHSPRTGSPKKDYSHSLFPDLPQFPRDVPYPTSFSHSAALRPYMNGHFPPGAWLPRPSFPSPFAFLLSSDRQGSLLPSLAPSSLPAD